MASHEERRTWVMTGVVVTIHRLIASATFAERQMEALGRGVVAIAQDDGKFS